MKQPVRVFSNYLCMFETNLTVPKIPLQLESEKWLLFKDSPTKRTLFLGFLGPQHQENGFLKNPVSEEYVERLLVLTAPLSTPVSEGTHIAKTGRWETFRPASPFQSLHPFP